MSAVHAYSLESLTTLAASTGRTPALHYVMQLDPGAGLTTAAVAPLSVAPSNLLRATHCSASIVCGTCSLCCPVALQASVISISSICQLHLGPFSTNALGLQSAETHCVVRLCCSRVVQAVLSMRTIYKVHINFPSINTMEAKAGVVRKAVINMCRAQLSRQPTLEKLKAELVVQEHWQEAQVRGTGGWCRC